MVVRICVYAYTYICTYVSLRLWLVQGFRAFLSNALWRDTCAGFRRRMVGMLVGGGDGGGRPAFLYVSCSSSLAFPLLFIYSLCTGVWEGNLLLLNFFSFIIIIVLLFA